MQRSLKRWRQEWELFRGRDCRVRDVETIPTRSRKRPGRRRRRARVDKRSLQRDTRRTHQPIINMTNSPTIAKNDQLTQLVSWSFLAMVGELVLFIIGWWVLLVPPKSCRANLTWKKIIFQLFDLRETTELSSWNLKIKLFYYFIGFLGFF